MTNIGFNNIFISTLNKFTCIAITSYILETGSDNKRLPLLRSSPGDDDKLYSWLQNFKNLSSKLYLIDNSTSRFNEVLHYVPPHLDLHCLQIQQFSFLAL